MAHSNVYHLYVVRNLTFAEVLPECDLSKGNGDERDAVQELVEMMKAVGHPADPNAKIGNAMADLFGTVAGTKAYSIGYNDGKENLPKLKA